MNARCLPLLAGVLCLSSCVFHTTATGPVQYDARAVERDASEHVRVELNMGAGELRVSGGTQKLMQGDFTYNVASWKPSIRYSSTGSLGSLTIEQPDASSVHIGNVTYQWDLRLNKEVPLDMKVHFGAGKARLDLGSLALRSVEVAMGVGELDMDLRGTPKRSYSVRVQGGVGEATIRLPGDVGVYAEAAGGIGEISARGLRREDGHWVNDAYEDSRVRIRLDVHGGVGAIHLLAGTD
jgi:hypothetical protein